MKGLVGQFVNRALAPFSLELRRLPKDRAVERNTLADSLAHLVSFGLSPRTVIDVGAALGTFELYEAFSKAQHLLIEPLVEFESDLKTIVEQFDAQYVIAAAGKLPGTATLHVHRDLLGSSLLRETEGEHVDGTAREVPVVTLDALISERGLPGPYVIKIDVGGVELEVIEGARAFLAETEVIILEVSLLQFFKGGPQFHNVVARIRELGFVTYDIVGRLYRPLDNALAQVDVVFVQEAGRFRRHHLYATPEQRTLQDARLSTGLARRGAATKKYLKRWRKAHS